MGAGRAAGQSSRRLVGEAGTAAPHLVGAARWRLAPMAHMLPVPGLSLWDKDMHLVPRQDCVLFPSPELFVLPTARCCHCSGDTGHVIASLALPPGNLTSWA